MTNRAGRRNESEPVALAQNSTSRTPRIVMGSGESTYGSLGIVSEAAVRWLPSWCSRPGSQLARC